LRVVIVIRSIRPRRWKPSQAKAVQHTRDWLIEVQVNFRVYCQTH